MSKEHNYMLCFQKPDGTFDVFAKFRDQSPISDEKLKTTSQQVLQEEAIIRDANGKHHFIEKGQQHG